jgi:D-3-phosphoglycerate dehydrogenase
MAVTVDSPVSGELLADIARRIGAGRAQAADLNPS